MREKVIERYLCQKVEEAGGKAIKFTSSNNAGLPDRICILPGCIAFIEVKAPGKKPRKLQVQWLNLFKKLGHTAIFVSTRPQVDAFMLWYKRFRQDKGVTRNTPCVEVEDE